MIAQEKFVEEKTKDKIVISATKTDNSRDEEPYEISVVGREEMDKQQVRDLDDALRRLPGATTNGSARAQAQKPVIRGLSGSRVLTVIDGVRQNFDSTYRSNMYIDFDLLKQVEVVRGPASALWGSGALAGVLSLQTVDPSDLLDEGKEWGLKLSSGFDSANDGLRFGTTLFGKADNIEYLFNVSRQESNDMMLSNGDRLDYSAQDNYSTLSKIIWHVTENDKLGFQYQTFYADERKPLREITSDSTILNQDSRRDTLKFDYDHNDADDIFDFSFSAYYSKLDLDDESHSGASWENTNSNYETYGIELRNSTVWAQSEDIVHTFTYGFEYFHDKQEGERDGADYPTFRNAEQDNMGIYIQDEIAIGESLVLIPGLRYDSFMSEPEEGEDINADKFNPKLGLIYQLTDDINLFANYSHGMRGPSLREKYIDGNFGSPFAPVFIANPKLEEETSENWDIGFRLDKSNVLNDNDNFKFRYAFFYSQYEDFIELDSQTVAIGSFPFSQTQQQYINVGNATIYGHEVEAQYSTEDLTLWANYTYNHGENETDGEPLNNIPAQTVNYGIDYQLVKDISIGYSGQFVDTQDRLASGESEVAGYNLHAIYARWAPSTELLKGFALTVGIDNLFDEEYEDALNDFQTVGIGRNVKASLSYTIQF